MSFYAKTTGLISVGFMFLLAACSTGEPMIELAQSEVDLGEVVNGEVVTLNISVANIGQEDLVIEGISTSCGCTSAEIEPTVIAPGGQGTLFIHFDSGAHGPETNGPVMRQVFIASNDPNHLEIEFRLHATILPHDR